MSWIITGKEAGSLGLLDQYGGAAAAYSLRNLSLYNTDPVVRVRRDNDDAEQDFTATEVSDGTLTAWVGAGNNGFVRTWYDQSGNGRNAFNTTTSTQPRIIINGALELESGKACLRFYSNAVLDSGFTGLAEKGIFAVADLASAGAGRLLTSYDGSGSAGTQLITDGASVTATFRLTDGSSTVTTSLATGNHVLYASRTATLLSVGVDSATLTQTSVASSTPNIRNYAIGEDIPSGVAETPDSIQEIIIYSSSQLANRLSIEANINAHYNIF